MHGLDGQHQDLDRTLRGRVSRNDRGRINGESTSMVWPALVLSAAKEQNVHLCLQHDAVAHVDL